MLHTNPTPHLVASQGTAADAAGSASTRTVARTAVRPSNRCLAAWIAGLTMLIAPVAAWPAAPVAPSAPSAPVAPVAQRDATPAGANALPYGSGYERRQLAQDAVPPAMPAAGAGNGAGAGFGTGQGNQGGSGRSGGRGQGRAR